MESRVKWERPVFEPTIFNREAALTKLRSLFGATVLDGSERLSRVLKELCWRTEEFEREVASLQNFNDEML